MVMSGVTGRPSGDLIVELDPMWWAEDGACRGMYETLSFWPPAGPTSGGQAGWRTIRRAEFPVAKRHREADCKAVCARCPVRGICLEWGITHDEVGIWGGKNDDERHAIRQGRETAMR